MIKITLNKNVSEIHLVDLSNEDIIIAKRKGKIVGTIVKGCSSWIVSMLGEGYALRDNLSLAFEEKELSGCEFYVLD